MKPYLYKIGVSFKLNRSREHFSSLKGRFQIELQYRLVCLGPSGEKCNQIYIYRLYHRQIAEPLKMIPVHKDHLQISKIAVDPKYFLEVYTPDITGKTSETEPLMETH